MVLLHKKSCGADTCYRRGCKWQCGETHSCWGARCPISLCAPTEISREPFASGTILQVLSKGCLCYAFVIFWLKFVMYASLRYRVSPFTFPIWENELVSCHSSPFFSIIFCLPSCHPKRTLSAGWWASTRLCCASLRCRHHNAASPLCL